MTRLLGRYALISIVAAIGTHIAVLGQTNPAGPEFQVNTQTVSAQRFPAAAAEDDGDFVIAWDSSSQDGSGYGVFARRFSSAGVSLATEFQVNTSTGGGQRQPSAAVDADGDFVIAWRGSSAAAYEVFVRRFSSAGTFLTGEIQANAHTPDQQLNPAVASEADGDFVVTWFSLTQDGASGGIFARRFSSGGAALASEFQVNTYTTDYQRNPSVSKAANGNFVVAWQSQLQDGAGWGVFARSFSSAGAPLTGELQVNTYTVNDQQNPSVAVSASGQFVVVWQSLLQDANSQGVFARRFSSSGAALANEFQISAYTIGSERNPSVAVDADGEFIVAWDDGIAKNVFARRFSSAGVPLTGNFLVNTYTPTIRYSPRWRLLPPATSWSLGRTKAAMMVTTWASSRNASPRAPRAPLSTSTATARSTRSPTVSSATGLVRIHGRHSHHWRGGRNVHALRRDRDLVVHLDHRSAARHRRQRLDRSAHGGLLALRFLFGFTGANLIAGAVGGGCTRCDAPSIEAYLVGLTT